MEYAADDINVGYMSCLLFINSEGTLIDKIGEIKEIQPENHSGGVEFLAVLKTMETLVSITMNYEGNFDIYATTDKGTASLNDQPVDTLINFLHIFYTNMQHDEDILLQSAIDKTKYRKAAKTMHYREMFGLGDDI